MYIELICQSCKKQFRVPFGTEEFSLKECPLCGIPITHTDEARLYEVTERLSMNVDKLNSVTIDGIYTQDGKCKNTAQMSSTVFYADIDHLSEVFNSATPEVKEQMASLLDTLYLLIYHDSMDGAVDSLDTTRKKLRTIFFEKVDESSKRGLQLLFSTEENNNA